MSESEGIDDRTCKVCLTNPRTFRFECGHTACEVCAKKLNGRCQYNCKKTRAIEDIEAGRDAFEQSYVARFPHGVSLRTAVVRQQFRQPENAGSERQRRPGLQHAGNQPNAVRRTTTQVVRSAEGNRVAATATAFPSNGNLDPAQSHGLPFIEDPSWRDRLRDKVDNSGFFYGDMEQAIRQSLSDMPGSGLNNPSQRGPSSRLQPNALRRTTQEVSSAEGGATAFLSNGNLDPNRSGIQDDQSQVWRYTGSQRDLGTVDMSLVRKTRIQRFGQQKGGCGVAAVEATAFPHDEVEAPEAVGGDCALEPVGAASHNDGGSQPHEPDESVNSTLVNLLSGAHQSGLDSELTENNGTGAVLPDSVKMRIMKTLVRGSVDYSQNNPACLAISSEEIKKLPSKLQALGQVIGPTLNNSEKIVFKSGISLFQYEMSLKERPVSIIK